MNVPGAGSWISVIGFRIVAGLILIKLGACSVTRPPELSRGHLPPPEPVDEAHIPAPVSGVPPRLDPPQPRPIPETYSVVVNNVDVHDLLFALARDAKINVDIHPDIEGRVSLNAIDQTLIQILNRIRNQVALRYELTDNNLVILPDKPYLKHYRIDYVNMRRSSSSTVGVATEIATTGGSVAEAGGGDLGNISSTNVEITTSVPFWDTLVANIRAIIGEVSFMQSSGGISGTGGAASATAPDGGSSGTGSSTLQNASSSLRPTNVIANPSSGIISVRTTQAKHREIREFLDQVMTRSQRQVLIEATIVEVELSDRYQAGIDWSVVTTRGGDTLSVATDLLGSSLITPPVFTLDFDRPASSGTEDPKTIQTTIKMLENFGNVKVLSSPKILALNNQTALLKVVDEKVYFNISFQEKESTGGSATTTTFKFESEIRTVPVGVILSVTPQVGSTGTVTLNVRPTITRITGFVVDPTPQLSGIEVDNLIPEIQIREMESLLQVRDGQTVMLGGLMQNKTSRSRSGIPWFAKLPWIGNLFSYRDDQLVKTELVVFMRPTILLNATHDKGREFFDEIVPRGEFSALESEAGRIQDADP